MVPPTRYGIVLFKGFQTLDVFGPLDILNLLSRTRPLSCSLIAETLDPVSSRETEAQTMDQRIVPTHTFSNAPNDIEVLLVPGGQGTRNVQATEPIVEYIKKTFPNVKFFLTVCTGSALAARAGILDGKRATSNKAALEWVS